MKKAELILAICVLATCTTFSVHASVDPLKYEEVPIILDKKDNIYEENGKIFIADKETLAVTDVQKNALEVVICIVEIFIAHKRNRIRSNKKQMGIRR